MKPMIVDIQRVTAKHFNLKQSAILHRTSNSKRAIPRHVAMALSRPLTGKSGVQVAWRFKIRNHSSIIHAERKIAHLEATNPFIASKIAAIREELAA